MMKTALGLLVCLLLQSQGLHAEEWPKGRLENVTFSDYPALANASEVSRRGQSPLTSDAMLTKVSRAHQRLIERQLDPQGENYAAYVPENMPADGYGLLVFIPPWDRAWVPTGWDHVLEMFGVIFVAAGHSDNDQRIFERRLPLALIAAQEMQKRYKINPAKIIIGGMSGGGRAAERTALAYPDVFKLVYLAAGSDQIGVAELAAPPKDLMHQMQENKIVFSTGVDDKVNLFLDKDVQNSFAEFCLLDNTAQEVPGIGHNVPTPGGLKAALRWLLSSPPIDPGQLAECRAKLDAKVAASLDEVKALQAKGDLDGARSALRKLDAHYGGLAAPESVNLAKVLDPDHH